MLFDQLNELPHLCKSWWSTFQPRQNGRRLRKLGSKHELEYHHDHRRHLRRRVHPLQTYVWKIHMIQVKTGTITLEVSSNAYRISMWTLAPLLSCTKVNSVTSDQTWKALASSRSTSEFLSLLGYFVILYVSSLTRQRLPVAGNITTFSVKIQNTPSYQHST